MKGIRNSMAYRRYRTNAPVGSAWPSVHITAVSRLVHMGISLISSGVYLTHCRVKHPVFEQVGYNCLETKLIRIRRGGRDGTLWSVEEET